MFCFGLHGENCPLCLQRGFGIAWLKLSLHFAGNCSQLVCLRPSTLPTKLLKTCGPRIPKSKKLLWAGDCMFVDVFDDVLDVDAFNTFVCVICLMLTHVVV